MATNPELIKQAIDGIKNRKRKKELTDRYERHMRNLQTARHKVADRMKEAQVIHQEIAEAERDESAAYRNLIAFGNQELKLKLESMPDGVDL